MRVSWLLLMALVGCAKAQSADDNPACAPQDATDDGTDCIETVGYAWTGRECVAVVCGCAGSDCSMITAERDGCEKRYASCR
jgi:hypothetical protein